ncbi:hypothetical protein LTS18_008824, partial [Coniosporium uncinatum]
SGFDQAVFRVVGVCVKVTARGFDGEAGSVEEERWQGVVNEFKRCLITGLQFLNNLCTQNERRKLMLWVDLFDSSSEGVLGAAGEAAVGAKDRVEGVSAEELSRRYVLPESWPGELDTSPLVARQRGQEEEARHYREFRKSAMEEFRKVDPSVQEEMQKEGYSAASSPFLLYIGKVGMEVKQELESKGDKAAATDIAAECSKRWQLMSDDEKAQWNDMYAELLLKYRDELTSSPQRKNKENVAALAKSINQLQQEVNRLKVSVSSHVATATDSSRKTAQEMQLEVAKGKANAAFEDLNACFGMSPDLSGPPPAAETDFRMAYDAAYGAEILQRGKEDLMKRLETYPETLRRQQPPPAISPASPISSADGSTIGQPPSLPGPPVDELSEEESEDDYVVPGDDGRGLLTDVPLILGPSEIEVLPMIILSGIVPPLDPSMPGYGATPEEILAVKNMHTVRCHLLLAQDNGRNLLRELLIFVAAWDLREEELYFKFMVKIMEAILNNGLMPFSYHAFRENKDIISPAQAVIMKLLTAIFRSRQSPPKSASDPVSPARGADDDTQPPPTRVDVHMVNFLLTEFRRHIIPQTCALIFLQGQIRAGAALPDDFPLNLWDMERMYEGVYQYLEFFAILTERDVWKDMMARWEVASELVTLLQELEHAIPKVGMKGRRIPRPQPPPAQTQAQQQTDELFVPEQQPQPTGPAPVAVERPFDPLPDAPIDLPPLNPNRSDYRTPSPANAAEAQARQHNTMYSPLSPPPTEPSDFPWKNLKKLT